MASRSFGAVGVRTPWATLLTCGQRTAQCEFDPGTPEDLIDEVKIGHEAIHVIEEAEKVLDRR
jgi:hypothetical protein